MTGETAEGVLDAGGAGGVAHPLIEFPRAPVAVQGALGAGAARTGETRRRLRAPPTSVGRIRKERAFKRVGGGFWREGVCSMVS